MSTATLNIAITCILGGGALILLVATAVDAALHQRAVATGRIHRGERPRLLVLGPALAALALITLGLLLVVINHNA